MRLHKISLLNLNSLYGEQSLDLERDLQGANLFLIHGRTGSGKSTVMDAVSLALFGKTPRLDAQRNALGADPCGIMSRGTGECRAEVEFSRLCGDRTRIRYRAIWSVRRAHRRAEGSLQPVERSLEQLLSSGQWKVLASGRKMVEFNEALSKALDDFTVDDFHRSMLLAQGRFDELLSAKPEHRAAILERLTNTAEYATIGSNAAELARAHKKNVEFLNRALGDATAVTDEEFREVNNMAAVAHAQTEMRASEFNTSKSRLQWWIDRKRLCSELGKLDSEKLALGVLAEQLAPTLTKLAEHTRCIAGFAAMDHLETLDRKVAESTNEINRYRVTLIEASAFREKQIQLRDSDERTAKLSEDLLLSLQSPCAGYLTAKEAADDAKKSLDGFQLKLASAQNALAERIKGVAEAHADLELAKQNAAEQDNALVAYHRTQLLRERWSTQWQEFCISLESQEKNLRHTQLDLTGREQRLLDAVNKTHKALEDFAKRSAASLAEPAAAATRLQARLTELIGAEEPKSRIRELRNAVEQKRCAVEATRVAQRELLAEETIAADLERAQAQLVEAKQTFAAKAAQATRAREVANHAALRRADSEKHVHRLELVVEVSTRREALSQGEQCPLCGSVNHPYLDDPARCPDDTTVLQALTDARTERELLEKQASEAERLARDAEKTADKYAHELDTKQAECSSIAVKIQGSAEAAAHARKMAGLPKDYQSRKCAELLDQQVLQLGTLQVTLKDLEEASDASDAAQRELANVQLALAKEEESLKVESIAIQEQKKSLAAQRINLDEARQDVEERRSTLRAALQQADADLLSASETNPSEQSELVVWRHKVEAQIAFLDKAERSSEQAKIKLREALKHSETENAALAEAEKHLSSAKAQAGDQSTQYRKFCDRSQELLDEIRGLWATRPPDDPIERELPEAIDSTAILERARQRVQRLRESARNSREAAQDAVSQEQQLQGTLNALNAARAGLQNEQSKAQAEFLGVLAGLGLETAEQLCTRRMHPDEVRAEQAKVNELGRRQQDWAIRQQERRLALEKHELAIPPGLMVPSDAEREALATTSPSVNERGEPAGLPAVEPFEVALATAVAHAETQLRVANDTERECHVKLADTKQRMTRYATAEKAIRDAQNRASVWLTLDALIGTRNGDAFRQFAQGLNLHRLIQKANDHLQRLSERYLLTQARNDGLPTLDFAIKDLWQGGEPRSTRTLSGGERFLVSLALALGLSDLRTQSLPIETLILDEGFGTLDPETLEVALAALQRLHADGRQVGVISHVNGLKERIEAQVRIVEEGAGRSRIVVGR